MCDLQGTDGQGYYHYEDCEAIGDATGYVAVPPGKGLWLSVHVLKPDLSVLDALAPDDLQGFSLPALSQIDERQLAHLAKFTSLLELDLSSNKITDEGLANIKNLTSLRILSLAGTETTDAGLANIEGLTSLRRLELGHTKISNAGLAHLLGLNSLLKLDLVGTKINNAGLVYLKKLTFLKQLSLHGTDITLAGLQDLTQALPNCLFAVDWVKYVVTEVFFGILICIAVALVLLPTCNRSLIRKENRGVACALCCVAGLLVWFGPVILPELKTLKSRDALVWSNSYPLVILLGFAYGIAIYFQHDVEQLRWSKPQPLIGTWAGFIIGPTYLFLVYSIFYLVAMMLIMVNMQGYVHLLIYFFPFGFLVSAIIGWANSRSYRRNLTRLSETINS